MILSKMIKYLSTTADSFCLCIILNPLLFSFKLLFYNFMYTYMHVYIHVCMNLYMYVFMYAYMHVHMDVYMHVCTCVYSCVFMWIDVCRHVSIWVHVMVDTGYLPQSFSILIFWDRVFHWTVSLIHSLIQLDFSDWSSRSLYLPNTGISPSLLSLEYWGPELRSSFMAKNLHFTKWSFSLTLNGI